MIVHEDRQLIHAVDKTDCLVNKRQTKAGTNEMRKRFC